MIRRLIKKLAFFFYVGGETMRILTLKNGDKIELQWSFLIMQYLEDYEGGLKKLKADMQAKKNLLKVQSLFIYSAVRANYDKKLGYQEAIRLVNVNDLSLINDFFKENFENQENFKKKDQKFIPQKKKKKR